MGFNNPTPAKNPGQGATDPYGNPGPAAPGAPGIGVPAGGTTGQGLVKNSNTNYDTTWATIGGLSAIADQRLLANISGAAAVPSANSLTAILDSILGSTQGQLITRNGANWTVLGPSTGGKVLTENGAGANLSWNIPATGGGPAFSLYSTITVNITTFGGIDTKVPLDSATFDTASGLDVANNRWICPLAGYYQINGNIYLQANSTGYTGAYISIWVNGSRVRVGQYVKYPGVTGTNEQIFNGSWVIYLAAGDYLEMFCTTFLTGGGIVLATFINSSGQYTTLDGIWIRA